MTFFSHGFKLPFIQSETDKPGDLFTFVSDMILGAVDTSSNVTSFFLYHLARNPDEQAKLSAISLKGPIGCKADLQPFIKGGGHAAMRESMRLNPISVGVGRMAAEDICLSTGHVAEKGSMMVTQGQVACRFKEHFDQPDEFIPDRWKRGNQSNKGSASSN